MRARPLAALAIALVLEGGLAHADGPTPAPHHEPTLGDLASARNALREGVSLREKGDTQAALQRLQSAWDLVPTPITGFELGKTHLMLGHVLQSHELFAKVVRLPSSLEESPRSASARDEAARLMKEVEPRIPSLHVKLTLPPGASATVRLDDEMITMSGTDTKRLVEAGPHDVIAKAGDGPEQTVHVDVAESEVKEVVLTPQWVAPKVEAVKGPNGQVLYVRSTNPLTFVGFGLAAAGLLVASISTVVFINARNEAADRCGVHYCPPFNPLTGQSNIAYDPQFDSARTRYQVSFVTGVVGGITTVVFGGIGAVFASRPVKERVTAKLRPTIGLGGAGLSGSF